MRVTSSTEGQIRTLPEPPIDGATYVPRVSSAAHIDPPDVADVEGVAPAGSAQGEGESPGGRACYMYMYVPTTRSDSKIRLCTQQKCVSSLVYLRCIFVCIF